MELIAGIDIGGTKIAVGVGHDVGAVLCRSRRATAECGDGDSLLDAVSRMVEETLEESGAKGHLMRIGLALPGPVDRQRGCLVGSLTLPLLNFRDLREFFEERFDLPVALDNDANAAALGEAYFGAGRKADIVVYFTVSTGVGGGIVVDGRLFRGAHGYAAEFGHQTILPGGPRCACGKYGCLEALVSGPAIERRARQAAALHPESRLATATDLSAANVASLAAGGDGVAQRIWEETGYYLGIGVAHAIAAIDPDIVILGGGVTGAGELLLGPTRLAAARHLPAYLSKGMRIEVADLADDVGILGAIALAMESAGMAPGDVEGTRNLSPN
jgi:glucokinase